MNSKYVLITIILCILLLGVIILPLFQAAAIEEAENYRHGPNVACAAEETPSMHLLTGARYDFSSSCLAPGWIPLK